MPTSHNATNRKTGKRRPRYDERTAKLARYMNLSTLPTAPETTGGRAAKLNLTLGMLGNDKAGDCTIAGADHAEMFWAAAAGNSAPAVSDDQAISTYSQLSGYDPHTGANDNGLVELDVLNYWRKTGIAGNQINAYGAVNLGHEELVRTALWMFDGLYLGVQLPLTAQGQKVWDVNLDAGSQAYPGSWGGHCIFATDYDADGVWFISWGELMMMTWAFFRKYNDEAYGIIDLDQRMATGKTVEGFDDEAMAADIQLVTAA